ncbi:MAG: adenylate/guanylate cyclase domain-containing protein, partial [Bacteroidota bacterium]|nr:adenylate/guanylate cyclase domain-containing protein [Bacteroidota bacterium]
MSCKIILHKINIFFIIVIGIFLYSFSSKTYAQEIGAPYIQNIQLKKYGFENNNYAITQDASGVLYISNSNGVLQYDGNNWSLIKTKGIPYLCINKNNIVFVGGYNEFGYLDYNNKKGLFFNNLVKSKHIKFGQVNKIFPYKDKIFFCTKHKLFVWNKNKLELIDSSKNQVNLFKINNTIYYFNSNIGLQRYIDNKFRIFPGGSFFRNKNIVDIFYFNKQLLIRIKEDNNFYFYNPYNYAINRFKTKGDLFIKNNVYLSGCVLDNNKIAIGTEFGGIVILNKKGEIVNVISQNSNLSDSKINFLYKDNSNNLWALHNNSISRIEISSEFSFYNNYKGVEGTINDIIRFNELLYIATSKGVYVLKTVKRNSTNSSNNYFKKLNGLNGSVFKFHKYNKSLFISSSKGIYRIYNNNCILFFNRKDEKINTAIRSDKNKSLIYIGGEKGISVIKHVNGILIILGKINNIPYEITELCEENNGTLWAKSKYNGLFRIKAFNKYSSDLPFKQCTADNNMGKEFDDLKLFKVQGKVIFSSVNGIYRFDNNKQIFIKDTILNRNKKDKSSKWSYPIIEDKNNNLWLNNRSKNNKYIIHYNLDTSKSYNYLPLNKLTNFSTSCIYPDNNKVIWFGGNEQLIRFDFNLQRSTHRDFYTLIYDITIGKDSVIQNNTYPSYHYQQADNSLSKFSYDNNTMRFTYTATNYESEDGLLFQTQLFGFDDKWSNWSSSNYKEYTNLREGNYIFQVRSKDIYGNISDIKEYKFIISPPFYRTLFAFISYFILFVFSFILIFKWRAYYFAREKFKLENVINERTEEIVLQKEKADNLLNRVLPKNTANELKSGKKAGPYHYKMTTVLFSDIQGFTKIAEQLDSDKLIDELDKFFLKFDSVVEKYNIEKIKTIGDAYMCAGGIPIKNRTNPVEMTVVAMEIQNYMKSLKRNKNTEKAKIWDLRIGIDTGPVIAGVLGRNKITYDIWGGTVNTASRMESSGEPGKINITENTYLLIKDFFICRYRGKMPVKHKGEIDMYFVESYKPKLASDVKGLYPNDNFFIQLQLLRFNDLEEFILEKIQNGLPDNLFYHDIKHTIDVVTQVELIGRSEEISDKELLLLKTAALFHDIGHLVDYDTHEEEGVKLAIKILPEYKYSKQQIEEITKLIMVTKLPQEPINLLEEIICDADLDYLG